MAKSIVILIGFLFVFTLGRAQSASNITKEITSAINQSNSDYLISKSKDKVFINILSNKAYSTKAQAKVILKDFFKDNPINGFSPNITNLSNGITLLQGVGKSKNKKFNIKIRLQKIDNTEYITEITIEHE